MCDETTIPPLQQQRSTFQTDLISGMVSGAIYSLVFNPWDRAVYLSMKHKRSFLKKDNFVKPYHGAIQAMTHRMFFGSTYYLMQGQLRSTLVPYLQQELELNWPSVHIITGFAAGAVNGFITNAPSLIKAHTWGNNKGTFRSSIIEMYQAGGVAAFSRGLFTNVMTDSIRGSSYELFRHLLRKKAEEFQENGQSNYINFSCDAMAAFIGTVVASPLNYARIQKYAAAPHLKPPSVSESLKSVWSESKASSYNMSQRVGFFQSRFCIGVGTLRAAAGMAVGQLIFDEMRVRLRS